MSQPLSQPLRIAIVVGEISGDTLGAGLLRQLKQQYPHSTFEGIGGEKMRAEGFHSLFDLEELAVMGLVEVLSRIRRLYNIRAQLFRHFTDNPPDVFIGIDAPDFNLGLAEKLKRRGIRTAHYVSPTVWAWRENRVHKIKRAVDLVLCLFPFEPAIYKKYSIPATFVGHALADHIPLQVDSLAARLQLSLPANTPLLAILPGSRASEVVKLLAIFIDAAEKLASHVPGLRVVIPAANKQRKIQIEERLRGRPPSVRVTVLEGCAREAMIASDAVLLASGTAALEAMLCKRPMVVAYKLAPMTHWLMGFLYRQQYFALPNILAGRAIVSEFLQQDVNGDNLAAALREHFESNQGGLENSSLQQCFTEIHQLLRKDADKQAAIAIQSLLAREIVG